MFFMYAIAAAMLAMPGLIALYIHRGGVKVTRENWQEMLVEYLIFSFLILVLDYGFMFLSSPRRTVSFSLALNANSTLLTASFVFKYSFVALLFAAALPCAYRRRAAIWAWLCCRADVLRRAWQKRAAMRTEARKNKPIR